MVLEKYPTKDNDRPKFCRLPFIRGIFNLYDSLVFGYKCLMRSAEIAGLEEEETPKKGKAPVQEADKQAAQAGVDTEGQAPETGEIGGGKRLRRPAAQARSRRQRRKAPRMRTVGESGMCTGSGMRTESGMRTGSGGKERYKG